MSASRKSRTRHRQTGPAGLVFCLVLILAAVFVVRGVFVIKRISVSGNETIPDAKIIGEAGLQYGASIFSVDKDEVERAFDSVGEVKLNSVDVVWPNEVRLSVRERTPVAIVDYLGMSVMVDEWSTVIEVKNVLPSDGYPVVTGLSATGYQPGQVIKSSVYGQVDAMTAALGAMKSFSLGSLISELNVGDLDNLYMMTRSGILIKLGDQLNMEDKMNWMQNSLVKITQEGIAAKSIDVTSGRSAIVALS